MKAFKKKAKPVVEEPEDEYGDDPDYGSYDEYDDQAYDDYGDDGQYDDYKPAPKRSASSKSSKKNSKKKKKAAGMPPWLKYVAFGLAGVLVVSGLAGAIVMAVGSLSGSNVINLAWLPEDADLFVKVEPDELWNAPMLATVRDNETVKLMMEQATQQGGVKIGLSDIDSVIMAGLDMSDTYQQRVGFLGNRVGRPTIAKKADAKMIGVMRFKRDVTVADLGNDAESRKKDHGGKTYYSAPDGQAVYLADARTMLVGQEGQVTAAMDRGPTEPRVRRIDFVNPGHQLLFVVAPPKLLDAEARSQIQTTPSSPSATPAMQKVQKSLNESTKAFAFGLSLTSDIKMEVQMQCFSSSEAESLKTDLDTALAEVKAQFESSTGQIPPQFADFAAIGKEAINSLSAKKSGDEVGLAMQVPGRITTAVQDAIAANPMAAMMLQGMTQQFKQQAVSGSGEAATNVESLNHSAAADTTQDGQPSNAAPEDFEAGVRQDQQNTLDTLNGVRGQIKKTTGAIQDSVPGGK
ncbi:MAG: hypothetical protein O2945_12050 [Planctomycetota bacterium]|nr:hypothetical protein [Planctomycetota bacterium]MDA0919792.1 hypothetical protein [Planctomycetota bacterium]